MKFVDEIRLVVASGRGGPGAVSFRREAMTPRGGPDGGDGGKGGDFILQVHHNLNSLVDLRGKKRLAAQDGQAGAGANCAGPQGADFELLVPPGTIVRDEAGHVLVDMAENERYVLLKGGRGGKGNAFFKTSVNQAPLHAQPGEDGEEISVQLELKLIADVGIIGLPNAGKSTLISRISAARPKIADYPFTTLSPNLGVVQVGEYRSFVVADIPGLIRGAHQGVGLGIQFLRHIERTRVFVHLVDVSAADVGVAVASFQDILHELEMYDGQNRGKEGFQSLMARPQIVVLNKIDSLSREAADRLQHEFERATGVSVRRISAVSGNGVPALVTELWQKVEKREAKS